MGATLIGSCAGGDKTGTKDGSLSKNEDEENFALVAKARKGKGKKFPSKSEANGTK